MKAWFIAGLAVVAVGASAQAITIDNFNTGSFSSVINSASSFSSQAGSMTGGARFSYHEVESNPFLLSHTLQVTSSGVANVASKSGLNAFGWFGYGFNASGIANADLNLNLSGRDRFRVGVLSNDQDLRLEIRLRSSSGSGSFVSSFITVPGRDPSVASTETVLFSSFGAGVNFADIDQIILLLDSSTAGDVIVDNFEAVPEPGTMLALAAGVGVLAARRRKKA